MSRLARNLLCVWVGAMLGGLGGLLVAIFWPLLFPLSLLGSSRGEDAVAIALSVFFLSFAVHGFLLCRSRRHLSKLWLIPRRQATGTPVYLLE
jgi:ABC-type Fe3+-siderophore transport system permease subunit